MIALGSDHGGLTLKRHVMEYLDARGLEYQDFGCYTAESCDYPDFGRAAAEAVASGACDAGHGRRTDREQYGRPHRGRLPQHAL